MPLDAISTQTRRWTYTGNGVTTAFAYNNYIVADTDLEVYLELIASPYTATLQTLTTHYTVDGVGTIAGGNVNFVAAPSSAYKVVIVSKVPNTQPSTFAPRRALSADALTAAYHRLAAQVQQLQARLDRTVRLADGDSESLAALPALRGLYGMLLGLDADGDLVGIASPDAPVDLTGQALKFPRVNAGETAYELITAAVLTAALAAATESAQGAVELATNAETITGADTARATHPAGVKAAIDAAITALRAGVSASFDTLAEIVAGMQPLDADLTAIAALATTSYGRALLTLADQAALTAAIAAATVSLPGIAELATNAEALTGTDTARIVTPDDLAYVDINRQARTSGNKLCPFENLAISRTSATALSVTADEVVLFNSNGLGRRFATLSETPAITSSGANGLDTGSEGSSRWYHIWAIGKEDGTLDTLLSESATAPTLPSGYTYKGYVGAVYNDGSSNFVNMKQRGPWVTTDNTAAVSGGTATSPTSFSIAAMLPPTAVCAHIRISFQTSSGTANCSCTVFSEGSFVPTGALAFFFPSLSTSPFVGGGWVPLTTASTLYYAVSGTNCQTTISVEGWSY